ncbi:Pyruvate/Phosphoenolpyruvate kinase-like domain-containing protein [Trichoderma compactum]
MAWSSTNANVAVFLVSSAALLETQHFASLDAEREAQKDSKKTLFGVAQGILSPFLTKVYTSTRRTLYGLIVIHATQHHSEGQTMAIVRVPKEDEISLTTALDAGAAGIIIPHCESKEEVEEFTKKILLPPWVFTPGISDTSLYANDAFNMKTSNNHVAVITQIESVKGIANVDDIASIPGISALMFGPGDFMADAGLELTLGQPHPTLAAAMESMSKASKRHNVPLFGVAMNLDMVPMLIESGHRAIIVMLDVWGIANMVKANLEKAKGFIST